MSEKEETKEQEVSVRDQKLNIHQRINRVMEDVSYLKKDKKISMGTGGFKVTGHDAVTGLIHPFIVRHGINIVPTHQEMKQEGNRTVIKMGFDWINIDDPKDLVHQDWQGYGIDTSDKGPGKASSYIQRFAVLKMLHIETGDQTLEEHDIQFKKDEKVIEHSDSVKSQVAQDDLPLEKTNGSKGDVISPGAVVVLERKIKGREIKKEDMKKMLDSFQIDSLSELLISDYKGMEKLITEEFPF